MAVAGLQSPWRVAFWCGMHSGYFRRVVLGLRAYGIEGGRFVFPPHAAEGVLGELLREWRPDGVIAEVNDRARLEELSRLKVPIVNVSNSFPRPPLPLVTQDDGAVGRMAAEHLRELGLVHYAFLGDLIGVEESAFSTQRREAFEAALPDTAVSYGEFHRLFPRRNLDLTSWSEADGDLSSWLRSLPKPVGVFAVDDRWGGRLIDIAVRLGYRVPADIAIMGCGEDDFIARFTKPPLSSIALPAEEIGRRAAELLERLMRRRVTAEVVRLAPLGAISRGSTNTLVVSDPEVSEALGFMRQHMAESINVEDVVRHVAVSRTRLQARFKAVLGRTPLEELHRVRVEHAKRLLADTDLNMQRIARSCGLPNAERLAQLFRRCASSTPSAYRRKYQGARS